LSVLKLINSEIWFFEWHKKTDRPTGILWNNFKAITTSVSINNEPAVPLAIHGLNDQLKLRCVGGMKKEIHEQGVHDKQKRNTAGVVILMKKKQ